MASHLHDPGAVYAPCEFKFQADALTGEFEGYAAVFGNVDSHGDVIEPGAFKRTLADYAAAGRRVPMHIMHKFMGGDGVPPGVWRSVREDSKGLAVAGKISGMNTDKGRHLFELVKDGALAGLSIGFHPWPDGTSYAAGGDGRARTLKSVRLSEISLVDAPSNPLTMVEAFKARPFEGRRLTSRGELEDLLQECGLPRGAARAVAADGFAGIDPERKAGELDFSSVLAALDTSIHDFKTLKG